MLAGWGNGEGPWAPATEAPTRPSAKAATAVQAIARDRILPLAMVIEATNALTTFRNGCCAQSEYCASMSTVVTVTDRSKWCARTDNIVVVDTRQRTLLWVPRDLWCERIGGRINDAFAKRGHRALIEALAQNGIQVEHSLCIRRDAAERAIAGISVVVPVEERLEFLYPIEPQRPIEWGSKRVVFEPPSERLAGERIHQWIGARYEANGRPAPLLRGADYGRMRRQRTLLACLLEQDFDFTSVLTDPRLVSVSDPAAFEELMLVDSGWRMSLLEDVRDTVHDGKRVLERMTAHRELATGRPAASVIVLSYNSRHRIDIALRSLRGQDLPAPWETIVVDSGSDGCGEYVEAAYPEATVVRSERRLWPGAARNWGVAASRGECVAFLADDCAARPDWLRRRVELHRRGYEAVGGAVVNGTPGRLVGTANYLLEYSALLPSRALLAAQEVPHSLSYSRALLQRAGPFPEDVRTGEDTIYNERCLRAGASVGFDPKIQIAHRNPTEFGEYLRHHHVHGTGIVQCFTERGHRWAGATGGGTSATALLRLFAKYPAGRWWRALNRVRRTRLRFLPAFLGLGPLIWAGLWATSFGAWAELRRRTPLEPLGDPRGLPREQPEAEGDESRHDPQRHEQHRRAPH